MAKPVAAGNDFDKHAEILHAANAAVVDLADLDDSGDGGDITGAPFEDMKDIRLATAFFSHGGGSTPVNSNGFSWNNDFVTTTGNVVIDLLHNFHLECGARLHKLRVYEMTDHPSARAMLPDATSVPTGAVIP